jgi:hypothetical protein
MSKEKNPFGLSDEEVAISNRILHEGYLIEREVRAVGHVNAIPKKIWKKIDRFSVLRLGERHLFNRIYEDSGYIDIFIFKYVWVMRLFEKMMELPYRDLVGESVKGLLFGYSFKSIEEYLKTQAINLERED